MSTFMKKAVFLDRDGVLIRERGEYNFLPRHIILNDGVGPALAEMKSLGYLLIAVSNQGGIARGIYGHEAVWAAHSKINRNLEEWDVGLDDLYYCPHHPSATQCLCRKPLPLLLERAAARHGIDLSKSYFIGDAGRDEEAALAAGTKPIRIAPNENLETALKMIRNNS
jgi:D-glycero-D-manno-heptose 1,7-bisphosphate phosphatase